MTTNPSKSAFEEVLEEVPEEDRDFVRADARRYTNSVGGRPSDGARSSVRAYKAGLLTRETLAADRQRDKEARQ